MARALGWVYTGIMARIRRVVLDTLKPHVPSIVDVASRLGGLPGVSGVNIAIYEIDLKVENAKVTIEGEDIQYETVQALLGELGVAIHSIDEVVAGKEIVEASATPQD